MAMHLSLLTSLRDRSVDGVRAIAIVGLLASGPTGADSPSPTHARLAPSISIAHCLDVISKGAARNDVQCPGFLIEPLKQAQQTCIEASGKLVATPTSSVWTLDVDGDASAEYAFEYDGNVSCEGAWSVFECGSLGCPKTLYQKHDDTWRGIAEIWASGPEMLEVVDASPNGTYRDLRVGCPGKDPCSEYWYYHWTGDQYERSHLDVRGQRVEFAHSVHGLYGLVGETDVLASPTVGTAVVGHYGSDTEVEIVGTAESAGYYYVSPCNACDSGFVPKSAVRALHY